MKKIIYLIFAAVSVLAVSCTTIDSAEVGIEFSKFGLTDKGELKAKVVNGYVTYNPITTSIFTYPTNVQRADYPDFQVMTKDAAQFKMNPLIAYRINKEKAVHVFTKYRCEIKDIEQGYMRTAIYDAYRITANNYTSEELMSNRGKFEAEVRIMLDKSLNQEGFIVEEFTSQIEPPISLANAINAKNEAVQSSLKADNEVKKAEAEAKIAIAKANGEAQALKIKADGEAYYNRTVAASLNGLLIEQYAIEKWDGKLPQYTTNSVPFINLK